MFGKQKTLRWAEYMGQTYGWCGTESNDFIAPIIGQPFESNYPFKKFIVESDAPVFPNRVSFASDGPPNTTVNIKIAFQKGKVFDLFKVEKLINRPVIVTKLENGSYRIIKTNGAIDYTEAELEPFRVPVLINGKEMKDVDPDNLADAVDSTLTLQLKFNNIGNLPISSGAAGYGNNEGVVYLMLKKRPSNNTTPPDPRYYQQIIGAEIISYSQLKLRGAVTNGVLNENHPYVKDRKRITILDLNGLMGYRGVGSVEAILANKGPYDPNDFGGLIKKRVDTRSEERTTEVLSFINPVGFFMEEQFSDHLFTRIT